MNTTKNKKHDATHARYPRYRPLPKVTALPAVTGFSGLFQENAAKAPALPKMRRVTGNTDARNKKTACLSLHNMNCYNSPVTELPGVTAYIPM